MATQDVRTADPSADGCISAAIFATVKLPSAEGHIVSPPRGDTLFDVYELETTDLLVINSEIMFPMRRI